jgi:uncharacterized Zn-binding protein involved in type VI secretion
MALERLSEGVNLTASGTGCCLSRFSAFCCFNFLLRFFLISLVRCPINVTIMGQPAARLTDIHTCPMVTPGLPPIPHVGGPIVGPGCPTVLIGNMPAAVMGDMCICVGPPDTIIMGSTGVFIGGKPAARMGDPTAHGGTIALGCPTVLIGETGAAVAQAPAAASQMVAGAVNSMGLAANIRASHILAMKAAALSGSPLVHNPKTCPFCGKKM